MAYLRLSDPTTDSCDFKVKLSNSFNTNYYKRLRITKKDYGSSSSSVSSYLENKTAAKSTTSQYVRGVVNTGLSAGRTYTLYAYAQAANGTWYKAGSDSITMEDESNNHEFDYSIRSISPDKSEPFNLGETVEFTVKVKSYGKSTGPRYKVVLRDKDGNTLDYDNEPALDYKDTNNAYVSTTVKASHLNSSGQAKYKFSIESRDSSFEETDTSDNKETETYNVKVTQSADGIGSGFDIDTLGNEEYIAFIENTLEILYGANTAKNWMEADYNAIIIDDNDLNVFRSEHTANYNRFTAKLNELKKALNEDDEETYVTKSQLQSIYTKTTVTDEMISDLNRVLGKYGITNVENIQHFIAQTCVETGYGDSVVEKGSDSYLNGKKYGKKYSGVGYIQMTWDYSYAAFATYMILEAKPTLKDIARYRNPKSNNRESIFNEYNKLVTEASNKGYDISKYTDIVDVGRSYVAENFAWETAGYYWSTNDLTSATSSTPVDDVTTIVNKWTDSYQARRDAYQLVKKYIK